MVKIRLDYEKKKFEHKLFDVKNSGEYFFENLLKQILKFSSRISAMRNVVYIAIVAVLFQQALCDSFIKNIKNLATNPSSTSSATSTVNKTETYSPVVMNQIDSLMFQKRKYVFFFLVNP